MLKNTKNKKILKTKRKVKKGKKMNINLYSYQTKNLADSRPVWQRKDVELTRRKTKTESKIAKILKGKLA